MDLMVADEPLGTTTMAEACGTTRHVELHSSSSYNQQRQLKTKAQACRSDGAQAALVGEIYLLMIPRVDNISQ